MKYRALVCFVASTRLGNHNSRNLGRMMRTTRAKKREADDMAAAAAAAVGSETSPKRGAVNRKKKTKSKVEQTNVAENGINTPWYYVFTKGDAEYDQYMSMEWGFEKRGDQALYEKICLEGAQSGLSWSTILRKREAYRRTFFNFDPEKVAQMTPDDVQRIIASQTKDPRDCVVRHKGKIEAVIHNAKCLLEMKKEANEKDKDMVLDKFLWSFVNDKPILNRWGANFDPLKCKSAVQESPSTSEESEAMSKALKQKGWKFVGPTTCYALMQSCGMIIDHPVNSPEWEAARQRLLKRPGGYQERGTPDKKK